MEQWQNEFERARDAAVLYFVPFVEMGVGALQFWEGLPQTSRDAIKFVALASIVSHIVTPYQLPGYDPHLLGPDG